MERGGFIEIHRKFSWILTAGHVVECFDNMLYGFFAVTLAPIFFPLSTPGGELLASYWAFAAGFFARPIGAILFGHIGDKSGRRKPLLLSMMLVGLPTIGIGSIPSYDSLGLAAPILLIFCRLLQGIFYGAEFTGVNLYILENFAKETLGRKTGALVSSGTMGAVFATALGAFVSMESMPSWAWRLPFLCGGIAAFCIYLFRRQLPETKDFTQARLANDLVSFPWKEVLRRHKVALLTACLISGLQVMPLYYGTIFGNRLFKEAGFTASQSMLLNMAALTWNAIIIPFYGRLADKIGFYHNMLFGTLATAAFAFPAFYMMTLPEVSPFHIYVFIILLVTPGCIIVGCLMPYIAGFFPTHCRYSGVALGSTVGYAVFGGTAPLMASLLTDFTQTKIAPAFWLAFVSLVAALLVFLIQKRTLKVWNSEQKVIYEVAAFFKLVPYESPDYKAALALREKILRKPLGLVFLPQELEQEKEHIHIAGFKGKRIIATAVLVPEGELCKMQRVAVDTQVQGLGIGSQMVVFCEVYARAHKFKLIYCHARDTAVQFYLKNGYIPDGDYFDEDTIPHLKMVKML